MENCYFDLQQISWCVILLCKPFINKQNFTSYFSNPTINLYLRYCSTGKNVTILVLLMIFCAARFGHEPLCKLLQVSRILCFDLRLLPEEVLQVLKELDPHLGLLLQAALLLHQLGPHICKRRCKPG